ncbi:hypothetical protein QMA04_13120 [Planococcus sp. APC 3900]|uniref:Uncharacterized protein n=1 Tax=Planococcus notacanthi TaxID=3035188 RepID=A0ABT7ZH55_9BACL|nr:MULTISPECIES: hypothetical protein [unclassified Planococcus (in: firmicutes)]MDN3426473.1 hypothetical protein [Planococcus sp. APC 4016]MDN3439041.1 hypothetical protein [Planococcus sp. APC 3900]
MKKTLLWISVVVVIILVIFLVTGYHTTPEGAFEELQQSTDATLIPMVHEEHVILIDENGALSVALMTTERRFLFNIFYTDFEIFPTNLNVFDVNLNHTIAFLHAPENSEYTYGLVKNEEVKYLAGSWYPEYEDPLAVYPLTDYISKDDVEDVILWFFPQELEEDTISSDLNFLDRNEELIEEIKKDFTTEEFFIEEINP